MPGQRSICAAWILLGVVACNRDTAGRDAAGPPREELAPQVELSALHEPLPNLPAGPPGAAYFLVADNGVVRLSDGRFTRLAGAPQRPLRHLRLGGDGAVWIANGDEVLRLEGDTFKSVVSTDVRETGGEIEGFTVAADGHVWVTSFSGVAHHDGTAWRREPKNLVGAAESLLTDIEVDRGGKVWAISTHKLHVREAGMWRDINIAGLDGERPLFFRSLALAPDDSVYALTSALLVHVTPDGRAVPVALGPREYPSYDALSVSASGVVGVRDGLSGVDVIDVLHGQARRHRAHPGELFWGEARGALATDDSGRAWLSTELGLLVLGPGDAWTRWPTGTQPAISGEIATMLVVGAGPATLPPVGPLRTGGLTGKLTWRGVPLAAAPVEVCPTPNLVFADTPCSASRTKFATVTDKEGVWTLADVPLGTYGLAVKVKDKWRTSHGQRLGAGMQEGQIFDAGRLTIADK